MAKQRNTRKAHFPKNLNPVSPISRVTASGELKVLCSSISHISVGRSTNPKCPNGAASRSMGMEADGK